jgi:membrane protease YdiL (CAAX protease family)
MLARKAFPELVRLDFKAFRSFLLLMFYVAVLRTVYVLVTGKNPINLDLFDFPLLFFVFWEDMFFVFPSLFLYHLTKNKYLVAPVMLVSSIIFAIGHLYQGVMAPLILLGYVPAMFYFGRKYGFGTVMACHVAYDVLTYLTFCGIRFI